MGKFPNVRFLNRVVSAFGSTYSCESFFSKMKYIPIDSNLENQLRCATSNIDINLEKLLLSLL